MLNGDELVELKVKEPAKETIFLASYLAISTEGLWPLRVLPKTLLRTLPINVSVRSTKLIRYAQGVGTVNIIVLLLWTV